MREYQNAHDVILLKLFQFNKVEVQINKKITEGSNCQNKDLKGCGG